LCNLPSIKMFYDLKYKNVLNDHVPNPISPNDKDQKFHLLFYVESLFLDTKNQYHNIKNFRQFLLVLNILTDQVNSIMKRLLRILKKQCSALRFYVRFQCYNIHLLHSFLIN